MKVWEVIKEDTTSGVFASVAMPLFTGKKGKAHHKAARKAVGLEDTGKNKPVVPGYPNNMIRRVK
jgi:hypothetical protein|tara:strand:- start:903 stop:1097 length:195 start_codon:yes stop_codon:yes gene_type:complete